MKEQNLDALNVWQSRCIGLLVTIHLGIFFQTLVLDQKGKIVLLTRAPDLRQAQNTSNIQDIRIWVDKDGVNPTDDLKIILDELDLKNKKIGIEYEAYGMTGRNALKLNKSLENYCKVEDQSELITKLRVIKSSEELVYVKRAAELADQALDEAWKYAKAGANEAKILSEMQRAVLEYWMYFVPVASQVHELIKLFFLFDLKLKFEKKHTQMYRNQ